MGGKVRLNIVKSPFVYRFLKFLSDSLDENDQAVWVMTSLAFCFLIFFFQRNYDKINEKRVLYFINAFGTIFQIDYCHFILLVDIVMIHVFGKFQMTELTPSIEIMHTHIHTHTHTHTHTC